MTKRVVLMVLVTWAAAAGAWPLRAAEGRLQADLATIPNDAASAEHALRRLTYGPRPGEVDRVRRQGLRAWIDRQLAPSSIDDAALERRLAPRPNRPAQSSSPQEARRAGRESVQALAAEKILRAIHSERQLQEQLVDFWFNHFNVFAGKGRTALYIPQYERDAIRPHVLGRFRDLLGATAASPAMLFYLDNWLSVDSGAAERLAEVRMERRQRAGLAPANADAQPRRRGLNENYARELLELHTLGVDGGYTQDDIINVARAFTGWTIDRRETASSAPSRRPSTGAAPAADMMGDSSAVFRFIPALHDRGVKRVLGQTIPAGGGIEDGLKVLDIVATHPATARHVATKLARRFVSDDPPPSLVNRAAERFLETRGDLRETVRTIVLSPEFFADAVRHVKVKTPLEFVVSAVRASGGEAFRGAEDPRRVLRALQQLGMAPYMAQPPTGYDDTAEAWISPGALVTRMNIAQQLAGAAEAARIGGPDFQRR